LPRAKSTSYATTRVELGVKERDMMETYLLANSLPKIALGVAGIGASIGVGLAGFALYQYLKEGPFKTITDTANETIDRYDAIYNDPTTQAIRQGVDTASDFNPIIKWWRIFIPFV